MKREAISFHGFAEKFKSIGHPSRVAIINLLCGCERTRSTVKNIYLTLKLDQPSTSRHLNIMRKSGMLVRVQEGSDTFYSLYTDDPQVVCITKCFSE
jgi:DNA-binding transcriptional ArsR family regulator